MTFEQLTNDYISKVQTYLNLGLPYNDAVYLLEKNICEDINNMRAAFEGVKNGCFSNKAQEEKAAPKAEEKPVAKESPVSLTKAPASSFKTAEEVKPVEPSEKPVEPSTKPVDTNKWRVLKTIDPTEHIDFKCKCNCNTKKDDTKKVEPKKKEELIDIDSEAFEKAIKSIINGIFGDEDTDDASNKNNVKYAKKMFDGILNEAIKDESNTKKTNDKPVKNNDVNDALNDLIAQYENMIAEYQKTGTYKPIRKTLHNEPTHKESVIATPFGYNWRKFRTM